MTYEFIIYTLPSRKLARLYYWNHISYLNQNSCLVLGHISLTLIAVFLFSLLVVADLFKRISKLRLFSPLSELRRSETYNWLAVWRTHFFSVDYCWICWTPYCWISLAPSVYWWHNTHSWIISCGVRIKTKLNHSNHGLVGYFWFGFVNLTIQTRE